jgi:uncharacterized protein YydD (DUF2326 family)
MLKRLYSETNLLVEPVVFVPGLNIILGRYSNVREKKGINGIGKSSLVRLIDYLFLSKSAEKTFSQLKYDFLRDENHNVILEFKHNEVVYFIKRTFRKGDSIYFGTSPNHLDEYDEHELKRVLTGMFFPFHDDKVFFEGERYGTLMDFFIKDDLENHQRIDPLIFSDGTKRQIDKAIFNFFLYGLPTKGLLNFKVLVSDHEEFSKTIKGVENNIRIDNGKSIEEFRSERIKIEKNIHLLEKSLNDYVFLENYKNIEKELIEITGRINEHLKNYHVLNRKLKKMKEAYQYTQTVDTREIQILYDDVLSTFGTLVSKKIDEIIAFKAEILENRNKFLIKKELELQKSIDNILNEISVLEISRSHLYKQLEEKGALESITNTYEQLTIEKTQLAGNMKMLEEIDSLQEKIGNLQVSISEVKNSLLSILRQNVSVTEDLRELFLEILQNAIVFEDGMPDGHFDISANPTPSYNQLPFKIVVEIPKAEALGLSRLKIVVYDLMVFLHNINLRRTIPYFIIHDGVFHGISLDTIIKTLNFLYHRHLQNPCFQYITTFNENEIYIPDDKKDLLGNFEFQLDDVVVARYTDNQHEMIFKRNFK